MGVGPEHQRSALKPHARQSALRPIANRSWSRLQRCLRLLSAKLSSRHSDHGTPALIELTLLAKASLILLSSAGLLAILSNISLGSTRDLHATVVSSVNASGFSSTSRYVLAELQSGKKIEVRLRRNELTELGQKIAITEHSSVLDDIQTYSLSAPASE